jgi:(2Fe-2S) ferredoxin
VPKFDKHIFVCMNKREAGHPRGCCDPTGQGELQRLFKTKLAQRGLKNVRANKSGCLDQCELGPTVVVYPDAVWYGSVKPEDVDEIIDSHIIGGEPVARLVIPDAILNTTHKK